MSKLYIRFGEIPENEISGIYDYEEHKIIGSEIGVSVYECCKIDGTWKLLLPNHCKESTLHTLYGLLNDGKDILVLSGDEVGVGSDNEPLIKNCNIVCRLPDYYFSLDAEDGNIVETVDNDE